MRWERMKMGYKEDDQRSKAEKEEADKLDIINQAEMRDIYDHL